MIVRVHVVGESDRNIGDGGSSGEARQEHKQGGGKLDAWEKVINSENLAFPMTKKSPVELSSILQLHILSFYSCFTWKN